MPSPEQLFASYRDRGDLQALAAVFDATAPQLLLVAGHLVRDGSLAEDLLQTTFAEAMRSAARYDARRPLLPWLASILTNHARKLRRSRRRTPDPARLQAEPREDPFGDVLAGEVLTTVQQAIDRLPLAYVQVLTLRLVHELPPSSIAHALGLPPETVKTRLKRGMERLRRQLPKGLGLLLAHATTNGRGLAAVREDVLRASARVARVAHWTLASIGVMAVKQILTCCVLVGVALFVWWSSAAWSAQVLDTSSRASVVAPATAETVAAGGEDASAVAGASRELALPARADDVVFRGRCVDIEGRPLAGCRAAVWAGRERFFLLEEPPAAAITTGADGRFDLAIAHDAANEYLLQVGDLEHVERRRNFGPWRSAHTTNVGDVELRPGVRLSGRVVDRLGQPLSGVEFALRPASRFASYEVFPEAPGWNLRSGTDGRYATPTAIPSGRFHLLWTSASLPEDRTYEWVTIADTGSVQTLDLVFPIEDGAQSIRGRIVVGDHAPERPLRLRALGGGTLGTCRSDAHGEFTIPRIEPYDPGAKGPVTLTLEYPILGYVPSEPVSCSWGDHDVLVRVRPEHELTVRPLDPRTHEVVQDWELHCFEVVPGDGGEQMQPAFLVAKPRPDGSRSFALSANDHVLQVVPRDATLAPTGLVRRSRGEGDEWTVELTRSAAADVVVETAEGVPVAGSEVWSLLASDPAAPPRLPDPQSLRVSDANRFARWGVCDQPVDHGTTDENGRVRVRTLAGAAMTYVALGPGHVPAAAARARGTETEVRIAVQRGATLLCRFTPRSVLADWSPSPQVRQWAEGLTDSQRDVPLLFQQQQIQLHVDRVRAEQQQGSWQHRRTAVVGADGMCRCEGLPPGRYDVSLEARRPFAGREGALAMLSFGTVSLQDGATTELVRDLSQLAPCRVRGQVFLNGQPWRDGTGRLFRVGDGSISSELCTDAEGRFESEMVSGSIRLQLYYRHSGNVGYWFAAEEIHVTPGHVTEAVFTVRQVAVRVRIRTAAGLPAPGYSVTMETEGQPSGWQAWTTDAEGDIVIDPAPIKPFALIVASPERATGLAAKLPGAPADALLGPFHVPPTGDAASFEVRLPEGWR